AANMAEETAPPAEARDKNADPPHYREFPLELQEILAAHQEWLSTKGKKGQQAQLQGYDFGELNLSEVNLNDANLQNANLTGAVNLLGRQLAGADLTNARLPEAIANFENLNNIAVTSKNTAQIFITMLAACVLSWL